MNDPHVTLDAAQIEFHEGGNTIWVHGPEGATILRLKCEGKIIIDRCQASLPHGDAIIKGDLHICLPPGAGR